MMQFEFPTNIIRRFLEYLSSEEYNDFDNHSKSDYWKHHSNAVNIHISGNKIIAGGQSGFYIPPPKSSSYKYKYLVIRNKINKLLHEPSLLIPFIKRKFGIQASDEKLLTYFEAFDKVMEHDSITVPILSPYRINFKELNKKPGVIANIKDMKNNYFAKYKKYSLSAHVVLAYYFLNILNLHIDMTKTRTILEIGAGNGNLLSLLYNYNKNQTIIDVDLPETLSHSMLFILDLFPNARILMPHEAKSQDLDHYEFVFLTPKQISMIKDNSVDLAINTHSFQEMTHEQIEEYFQLIQRCGRNDSYFFTANRVEKIPCGPDAFAIESIEPPNRFAEYPWNPMNKTMIYEICRLHRLCQLDDIYLRLVQIKK